MREGMGDQEKESNIGTAFQETSLEWVAVLSTAGLDSGAELGGLVCSGW